MDTRQYVETRVKRTLAQTLEEFEERLERPLRELLAEDTSPAARRVLDGIEPTKRAFRKKVQALGKDCQDVMSEDVQINGYEPLTTRS